MSVPASLAPDQPILLRQDRDGVATLTLNRPARRNALSAALMAEIQEALDAIAADRTVHVVVIAGNGPVFCAGHDLKEIRTLGGDDLAALFGQCSRMMLSLVRLPQPVIARVHGLATAAGCQLVASCDLAVAAEAARFATPGVHIGFFCSTPMVALSRKVGRKPLMDMLLTGEPIDAATARHLGLVNKVVPAEALDRAVTEYAGTIAAKSPAVLAIGKEAFYRQLEMGLAEAYDYACEVAMRNMALADAEEGISAFVDKRKPAWTGA